MHLPLGQNPFLWRSASWGRIGSLCFINSQTRLGQYEGQISSIIIQLEDTAIYSSQNQWKGHQKIMQLEHKAAYYDYQVCGSLASTAVKNLCLHHMYRKDSACSWSQRECEQRESVSPWQLPGQQWQLCLCITAADSHFLGSDDTLTFLILDVSQQCRWQHKSGKQPAIYVYWRNKSFIKGSYSTAVLTAKWKDRQWAHVRKSNAIYN